jgi:hypothetical protein
MAQDKTKLISIKEFKMWLQGVEEMQSDGWAPDARQWTRIREKIDQVDDTSTQQPVYAPRNFEAAFPPMNTNPPVAGGGSAVPAPSNLNVATPPARPPRTAMTSSGLPVSLASGNASVPVKTPNIDTSHGKPYDSSFA